MQDDYLYEWDDAKSESNASKHGISFSLAQRIWDDPMFVEVHLESKPEDRWAVIGRVAKVVYVTAIITYRDERIRIISARKSTRKELDIYDKH